MTQLSTLVEQVLGENEELSRRLETLEIHPGIGENLISSESHHAVESEGRDKESAKAVIRSTGHSLSFEQDLYASPVYARTMEGKSNVSIPSSAAHSTIRSFLSNLSLADVSNVSILSLPITTAEIWNHHHYLKEHHRIVETHPSPRESMAQECCAISQGGSISWAGAGLKKSVDKVPDEGIRGDMSSSCTPDKILLLGTLSLYLSASSPRKITSAER